MGFSKRWRPRLAKYKMFTQVPRWDGGAAGPPFNRGRLGEVCAEVNVGMPLSDVVCEVRKWKLVEGEGVVIFLGVLTGEKKGGKEWEKEKVQRRKEKKKERKKAHNRLDFL